MNINQVASMGRYEPYTEHLAVPDVWVYAMPDIVRPPCTGWRRFWYEPLVVEGRALDFPLYGYQDYPCDEGGENCCHGLRWAASTDLAVWEVAVFEKWPNANISKTHTYVTIGVYHEVSPLSPQRMILEDKDFFYSEVGLIDCIGQALVAEGYSVHPMLKETP